MDIKTEKTRARLQAKARRQEVLQVIDPIDTALDLNSHFPAARFRGALIGGIWPLPGEIDTRPLLAALHAQGHSLALPCTPRKGKPLIFREWSPIDHLKAGPYGTREPYPVKSEVFPTLVLVPLLGFTNLGERLGYGGGYYDRTLAALRSYHQKDGTEIFACGVAFAAQEAAYIPVDEHDMLLDGILTERYFKAF